MNKESIYVDAYALLEDRFTTEILDAYDIAWRLKNDWVMEYICFTTKCHDGFCLFDTKFTDFTSVQAAAKRDLVAEMFNACFVEILRISYRV